LLRVAGSFILFFKAGEPKLAPKLYVVFLNEFIPEPAAEDCASLQLLNAVVQIVAAGEDVELRSKKLIVLSFKPLGVLGYRLRALGLGVAPVVVGRVQSTATALRAVVERSAQVEMVAGAVALLLGVFQTGAAAPQLLRLSLVIPGRRKPCEEVAI